MKKTDPERCYHCGDDCGSYPVTFDEKPFCCNGCRTVYEILRNNDVCEYYNVEKYPGNKSQETGFVNRYAFLDNKEIIEELLEFSDGGLSKVRFFIPSIHCSSCIWLLENLHRLNKGIIHSTVNFTRKEVSITFRESSLSIRKLVELLVSINYIPQITLGDLEKKAEKKQNRKIYYQLGVAGFCFGNIMLFSAPDYLAGENPFDSSFIHNFAYFNLILALPVVLYAAQDYFISAFKIIRSKLINIDVPIALGIAALFLRSAYDILSATGPGYMDSLSGLVFFLLIGKWYQGKTYQALSFERDYKSYFPVAVTIIDDHEKETTIPLKNLKPGHRIMVRNQELVPADALLVKGEAHMDYSFVTGESAPVSKKLNDRIFAGGRQIGSAIELIVEKEVIQSYLTELWNQDLHRKTEIRRVSSIVNRVSRHFTLAIIIISIITGIAWYLIDPSKAILALTSVLIVSCPCALALTIPFAFGTTIRIFGRAGFYLKKTEVIEQLVEVDTIVFDKTGTITRNDSFEIDLTNITLDEKERNLLKSLVRQSSHPISQALYKSLSGDASIEITNFNESAAHGIEGDVGGTNIKAGSEKFITGNEPREKSYSTHVYVSINNELKGRIDLYNKYREGLPAVISKLGENHELHLLSGDNDSELPNLLPLFRNRERLHFKQSPSEKLEYIRKLKKEGKRVLMIGDGLNDAGALKESDAGITIADNVYHFSPACDAILDSEKFSKLPDMIRFSGTSLNIVKAGFVISFLYNLVAIFFAATGQLTPLLSAILMPLSSVTVVAFATLSTSFMARKMTV